ncbi:nucleotidyl transferase AbiEii/AbiGii toxin family protein [Haloferula sp. A504]|uniref:nucleotidyl transferase AbiEii/AbiGii toxin family protein n=1 Tax=Haloferula sp. A504 TaxID=3373601 RepID=UPI0031C63BAE|nr:nucleotidyl transferase AbiEii/AbiGii toxin family protein [Verrucomicrobiaceae bacterium E54]
MLRFESVPEAVGDLLETLAPEPFLKTFALGGGTSLALRFGHRISVDLDFFTTEEFAPEALLLDAAFPHEPMVLGRSSGSLTLECGGVKIEFLQHRYPLLEPVEQVGAVRLLSLADVTAMKLNAIANRGSKKDFFDLVRILEERGLEEALDLFERKYSNTDRFVAARSLAWFEDAEGEPDPVAPAGPTWTEVKQCVTAALADLS